MPATNSSTNPTRNNHSTTDAVAAISANTISAQATKSVLDETRRAFLRAIGKRGGMARARAFTPDYQRMARACVRHESNVANGRKGGIAYVRKYGKRQIAELGRAYRLAHPSDLERILQTTLIEIGALDFEREAFLFPRSRVHPITGDFVFRRGRKVIYADGEQWHTNNTELPGCAERGTRDAHYDTYLIARGWHVLRVSEHAIRAHDHHTDGDALINQLRQFIFGDSAAGAPKD